MQVLENGWLRECSDFFAKILVVTAKVRRESHDAQGSFPMKHRDVT